MRCRRLALAPLCGALLIVACTQSTDAPDAATATATAVEPEAVAAPDPAAPAVAPTIDDTIFAQAPASGSDIRIPDAFHGVWDESPGACAQRSDARLEIQADTLHFHESIGKVEHLQQPGENEIVLGLAMRGEGEQWQAAERYRLSADGATLSDLGQEPAFTRVRCR